MNEKLCAKQLDDLKTRFNGLQTHMVLVKNEICIPPHLKCYKVNYPLSSSNGARKNMNVFTVVEQLGFICQDINSIQNQIAAELNNKPSSICPPRPPTCYHTPPCIPPPPCPPPKPPTCYSPPCPLPSKCVPPYPPPRSPTCFPPPCQPNPKCAPPSCPRPPTCTPLLKCLVPPPCLPKSPCYHAPPCSPPSCYPRLPCPPLPCIHPPPCPSIPCFPRPPCPPSPCIHPPPCPLIPCFPRPPCPLIPCFSRPCPPSPCFPRPPCPPTTGSPLPPCPPSLDSSPPPCSPSPVSPPPCSSPPCTPCPQCPHPPPPPCPEIQFLSPRCLIKNPALQNMCRECLQRGICAWTTANHINNLIKQFEKECPPGIVKIEEKVYKCIYCKEVFQTPPCLSPICKPSRKKGEPDVDNCVPGPCGLTPCQWQTPCLPPPCSKEFANLMKVLGFSKKKKKKKKGLSKEELERLAEEEREKQLALKKKILEERKNRVPNPFPNIDFFNKDYSKCGKFCCCRPSKLTEPSKSTFLPVCNDICCD